MIRRFASRLLVLCLVVSGNPSGNPSLWGQYAGVTPIPEELREGFESITPERCQQTLQILAGPAFEGRGTGQPGFTRAAHWVAGQVAELGLQTIGDQDTFFQMVPLIRRQPDMSQCRISGPGGLLIEGAGNIGLDRFTDEPEIDADVVLLNISGDNPSLAEELNLRDKVVIYVTDEAAAARAPRMIARKRPAAAIRVIDSEPSSSSIIVFPNSRSRSTSVSGTITRSAATQILQAMNGQADWLNSPSEPTVEIHELQGKLKVSVRIREEKAGAPNVVALLPGADPELRDEYVVVGAHLDHLGTRAGYVFPGADDNGSGSTAILEIARAMTRNPLKPKRSVLFIWFTGEEMGLQGSRYYVNNPILPLEQMTCMLNIDMVGRNEETNDETAEENEGHLHLVGSQKGDSELHDLVLQANQHIGFEFEFDEEDVFGRSDQINFYRQGVPVAFLFGGFHPDYHQPSDQVSEINYQKIARAAQLFYCTLHAASEHGRFQLKQPDTANASGDQ